MFRIHTKQRQFFLNEARLVSTSVNELQLLKTFSARTKATVQFDELLRGSTVAFLKPIWSFSVMVNRSTCRRITLLFVFPRSNFILRDDKRE